MYSEGERFRGIGKKLKNFRIPFKISFLVTGIASTIWFLVRVIPKPSRAAYPCMRAAAPFMSAFVIYLLTLSGSILIFRKAKTQLKKSKYIVALGLILIAVSLFAIATNLNIKAVYARFTSANTAELVANTPYGEPRGIFPGRVVWAWNPDATNENCTNTGTDGYFLAKNNNQTVINGMLKDAILKLGGEATVKDSWTAIFKSFNNRKGLGETDYQPGQTVFIKVNLGGGSWLTKSADLSFLTDNWAQAYYGMAETSPAAMIAVLDQLVNECGIPQENIYLGDPISHIYKHVYDQLKAAFPNVKYVDRQHSDLGRTLLNVPSEPIIYYSDNGTVMAGAVADKLYSEMENADYLINIAALKAHARAGVTLNTKNNFGSHTRAGADHLHEGLIAPENDFPVRTSYGVYRVLTDLMGHEKLGGNTVLFMIDGLWGGTEAVEKPVKWNSAPFNNDWPNSIFIAQDPVAIESVCMDFLRAEFKSPTGPGKARPQYGAIDDYLLQAADKQFWPNNIEYDPEGDGIIMGSLGICEHWNNSTNKQYSRNLGYDKGIELVSTNPSLIKTTVIASETANPPVFDGVGDDDCWTNAKSYPIDQTWITWGQTVDPTDFHGEYKVSWSSSENLLYFMVKITDDAFIDGYVYPAEGYPNFDVVEVFLDEDKSGGTHVFDNDPTLGPNAENAFSYHMLVSQPEDGSTSADLIACDLAGTGWSNKIIANYASHFPDFIMKKEGNTYTYEFSLKVYNDTYTSGSPENSRVSLTENKLMGMSLAYCDNDQYDNERDNFFGSVWVPQAEYNDHWMNANGYGSVRLVSSLGTINHAVVSISEIPDFSLSSHNQNLVIIPDLSEIFYDPDNDALSYSVSCSSSNLTFSTEGNKLSVTANNSYSGNYTVTLTANDGQYEASVEFMVLDDTPDAVTKINSDIISVYPNPASDFITISIPAQDRNLPAVIKIYGMKSELVKTVKLNSPFNSGNTRIEVNDLLPGTYILNVNVNNRNYNKLINIK